MITHPVSATDDVVKVEIWDIVDKGKPQKREGLKMETEETVRDS